MQLFFRARKFFMSRNWRNHFKDREMLEEPLRLTREGDAYIVTVEELITPDMFEPTYANQTEIEKMKASNVCEPVTPVTPSVRFDGLLEDPVPNVIVTGEEEMMEEEEHDLPPPFQQEEVTMACGMRFFACATTEVLNN